jgi:hypothetical protein
MIEVEIKEGLELDHAVVVAAGIPHVVGVSCIFVSHREWDEMRGIEHPTCEGDIACIEFYPSTDLNDAFAAAEKVGLFSETFWRTLGMDELGETWAVFEQDGCVKKTVVGEHATPALAICAAILNMKGSQ